LLWAVALVGLAILAGFTLWFAIRALSYPYQLLYGEGFMLEFARRLAEGEALYKPLAEFPLGTVNYPPLAILLARFTFPLTGFGYAAGRVWALLATLSVAGILFAWVRRATEQILPAAAAALVWLGAPYVYHWAPQFRVDLIGLAFSLAGVYLVWRKWGSRGVYAAAPLFVLGLFSKQSFWAAPAAAIVTLFLFRSRRQGLILAGLTLLLGGVPFVVLNATTNGAFWGSMVEANVNLFHLDRLVAQLADLVRTYLPLIVLTGFYLLSGKWGNRRAGKLEAGVGAERLVVVYLVLALLTAALAGKAGSWENYFLEPLAALCLGGGLGLARLPSLRAGRRHAGRWLAPLLVLVQVALMWHTPAQAARLMRIDAAANQAFGPEVATTPGILMSEDAGLLVQAGKPVPYYDFQLSQLALAGRWDQAWEVENLRQGAFPMVIFEYDTRLDVEAYGRYTHAFVSALDYGYRQAEQVGKYTIYRPAPLDRERPVRLEGGLALVGHTLPPVEVHPGETLSLDVVWQATQPLTNTLTSFLHLLDVDGQGHAGDDRQPWDGLYPTPRWAVGEMVRMTYRLRLPADLPGGLYSLDTGWYDTTLNRLQTGEGADHIPLAVVSVSPVQEPSPQPLTVLQDASFVDGIRLEGYHLLHEDGELRLTLTWVTGEYLETDYTVFVHLLDAEGTTVAQGDGPPLDGAWPTSLWPTGYRLQDLHVITLSADLPPGDYELLVGLYEPSTGLRLPLAAGGDAISLDTLSLP
jgi:hypothetical protein